MTTPTLFRLARSIERAHGFGYVHAAGRFDYRGRTVFYVGKGRAIRLHLPKGAQACFGSIYRGPRLTVRAPFAGSLINA